MKPVRLWLGLLLVTLGVFGMLDVLGVARWDATVGRWWPLAIVALGLVTMAVERRVSTGPSVVAGIGLVLLAGRLGVFDSRLAFPLFLVVAGAAVLAGAMTSRSPRRSETARSVALFGGSDVKERSQHFKHADISAVFGGATLDLREAHIDDVATVDATAVFGGVDVIVPEGWRVALRGIPIFGGFEDKTTNDSAAGTDAPTLQVNATSIFGAVTVAHKSG